MCPQYVVARQFDCWAACVLSMLWQGSLTAGLLCPQYVVARQFDCWAACVLSMLWQGSLTAGLPVSSVCCGKAV